MTNTISAAVREQLNTPRWVTGTSSVAQDRGCPFCGSMYGSAYGRAIPCAPVTCKLCGSVQCMSNGLGNGRCKVCSYGLLPGWSQMGVNGDNHDVCEYAKCSEPSVAYVPGRKYACMAHAMRKVGEQVKRSLAERDSGKGWARWVFTGPRVPW